MRLDWAINEKLGIDAIDKNEAAEIARVLSVDCKYYLNEIKSEFLSRDPRWSMFYRGIREHKVNSNIESIQPRKDREPLDMPVAVHDDLDRLFKKKFGWFVRSEGVFVTPSPLNAYGYGKACIFFPIGNYKYVWSPKIEDLYVYLKSEKHLGSVFLHSIGRVVLSPEEEKIYNTVIKNVVNLYIDRNLSKALHLKNEVSFLVREYYVLPESSSVVQSALALLQDILQNK